VEIRCGAAHFILDAGTGVRALGDRLMREREVRAHLLLSHLHWDHIQGLPFFAPLYQSRTELTIVSAGEEQGATRTALAGQMRAPTFPVDWENLPARISFRELTDGGCDFIDGVEVRTLRLSHPGGDVTAYRLDYGGRSVVYATDVEREATTPDGLREFVRGADVLIHDAQYTPEEYRGEVGPSRVGWGHSTFEAAAGLARAADVKSLLLFHHDPGHDDAAVAEIELRAQRLFAHTECAREGMTLGFDVEPERSVA